MAEQEAAGVPGEPGSRAGWMDWAGAAAAVLLAVIIADILSDGRLVSRHLQRWREGGGDPDAGGPGGG